MFKRLFDPTNIFVEVAKKSINYISVRKGFYNKLAKKLDDDYWYKRSSDLIASYDDFSGVDVFHITNEQLAHAMYLAVKQNDYVSSEFNNLKFITIDKQEKVVFAVCNKDNGEDKILKLIDIADSFSRLLSSEECKVYVDYTFLFSVYNSYRASNLMESLFFAISLEPVTVSSEDIANVINEVLRHFKNDYYLYDLIDGIEEETNDFFVWLKKGILIDRTKFVNYHMPLALYVNIFKYALDKNTFSSLHELFLLDERFNEFDKANERIIIDDELFSKSLKHKGENDEFVLFTDKAENIFARFKYPDRSSKLTDVVLNLMRDDLVLNSKIVRSCDGDVYLFTNGSLTYTSLREHIHSIAGHDEKFIALIMRMHSFFSTQSSYNDLRFQANTDFLSCMCSTEGKANIPFIQLSNIATVTEGEPFDYLLVIMMAIREYVDYSKIAVHEIYLREFSKVFHPLFINVVKRFIESGSYTSSSDKDIENVIFSGCIPSQVEFVENLPLDDSDVLSKLSFFDGVNLPENLLTALNKQREADKSKGYLVLDEYLNFISSRSVSKNVFDVIFLSKYHDQANRFLTPEKIIISSNASSNDNYQIVGVLWNHSSLRKAVDVIKSKELNCKEVYGFIANLFSAYVQDGLNVDIPDANELLLMDMSNMEFVLAREAIKYQLFYPRAYRQYEDYYDQVICFLSNTADLEENYDVFDYEELVKSEESVNSIDIAFRSQVSGMMLCKEHNHWHLPDDLCCDCKKVYEISNFDDVKGPLYKDKVAEFFTLNRYYTIYKSHKMPSNQVKLGLEHDLYDKFFGLVPKKLIVRNTDRSILGIKYPRHGSNFFDNIVELTVFKHIQRLKAILLIYQKLLPYILDGSFICTDKRIFDTIVMHKEHKGEIMIPNLPLMECDVIVSKDDKLKTEKIQQTKTVFANFLSEYIMSDEYLANMVNTGVSEFVDIVENIKQLAFSDLVIKYCLDLYKNYCKTHMVPFSTKHKLCPMCKKDGIIQSKAVFETQEYFDEFEDDGSDYDGGEANIYVNPYNPKDALKVFKSNVDLGFKSKILAKALKKSKLIDGFNREHEDIQIISVKKIYYMYEDGVLQLKGFTQDFIEDSFKISNLKDKNFVKEHGYSRIDIVEILIKVCKGITFLHSIGGFIGDLNGGNILIKDKAVYIIDIDGMSFDDVRNCVYTNLYIYPPSAESNNITKEDDWYSLAVQAFYYLTYSHPFRGICDSDKVPENEAERMTRGLSVLGNHGIVPPSISIGWDFLPKPLLKYFLDTFEEKKRESMLEVLQVYYGTLKQAQVNFTEIKRNRSVFYNISEYVYCDSNYSLVFKEKELADASGWKFYTLENNNVLVGLEDCSYFLDTTTEAFYTLPKAYDYHLPMSLLDGNIYYTSADQRTLFVDSIKDDGSTISTHTVQKATTDQILRLCVAEKDKFVFVENNADANSYDVYCNSIMTHSVDKDAFSGVVDIVIEYDELSKNWLVMFKSQELAIGVVIERDSGRISQFEIHKSLSQSICFYGNVLYYVDDGKIYYYNVIKGSLKSMECEYAASDSVIYRYGNKFVVVNITKAYMYEKP